MILQNIFSPYQQGQRLTPEQMDAADNQATSMLVTPEPGLFSGLSQSFRGLGYGAYKSGSAFLGAASSTVASPESIRSAAEEANEQLAEYGFHIDNAEDFSKRQSQSFDDRARELRKTAQAEYGVDPSTMGTIASTLHGLFEILPKATAYSIAGGLGMGPVLFGADLGISRAQELKDKGVDEETAATAGLWSFGAGALGLRVPAAFGPNRWISAAGGAGANMLFTAAEMGAISHILENQKYDDLAKQYELTVESMGVSGLFGAAAGAFFFRSPSLAARALDLQTQRTRVADAIYSQLRETDAYRNKADLAWKEAEQKAASVMELSRRTGANPEEILPQIRFDEKGEMSVPEGALRMPETQGVHWEMGSHVIGKETEEISIVHMDPAKHDRKDALNSLKEKLQRGLRNRDSGWELTGSGSDAKKTLPPFKFRIGIQDPYLSGLYNAIVERLEDLVTEAKLVESTRDYQHNNEAVKGAHKFVVPATYRGRDYRIQLLVRDYGKAAGDRLSTHSIDHVEVHAGGKATDGSGATATRAPAPTVLDRSAPTGSVGAPVSSQWSSAVKTTLADLLQGFQREDHKGAFDSIAEADRQEGGVYYDAEKAHQQKPLKQEVHGGFVPDADLIAKAKATFGTTSDTREGFYILPDGTMLDGSGRHWDPDHPNDYAGERQVDHGDVSEIEGVKGSGAEAMYDWMARTGAMRFDQRSGIASIARNPTPQQLAVLGQASRGKYLALSRNTPEGRIVNDVEFDRASPRKIEEFFRDAEGRYERGEITKAFAQQNDGAVAGFFDPETNSIVMTKNANLSTFSHEWGHWYLQKLFDFAREGKLTGEMRADLQALLDSFGLKSMDEWNSLDAKARERFHEQFARQFEQYLQTGKAPDSRLQYIFGSIARAIKEAYEVARSSIADEYKAQTGYDLPPMSDEVKAVFDRMFKESETKITEDQVAAARSAQAAVASQRKIDALDGPSGHSPQAFDARERAARRAEQAMIDGERVDVTSEAGRLEASPERIDDMSSEWVRNAARAESEELVADGTIPAEAAEAIGRAIDGEVPAAQTGASEAAGARALQEQYRRAAEARQGTQTDAGQQTGAARDFEGRPVAESRDAPTTRAESEELAARREQGREFLDEARTDAMMVDRIQREMPDRVFSFEDADGNTVTGTVEEIMRRADEEIARADAEAASYGTAAECVLFNRGIE